MPLGGDVIGAIIGGSTNLAGSLLNFGSGIYAINNAPDTIYQPTTIVRIPGIDEGSSGPSASTILIYAGIIVLVLVMIFLALKIAG